MGKHQKIEIGNVYGNFKVISIDGYRQKGSQNVSVFSCECLKCGNKIQLTNTQILNKKDCGCGRKEPRKPIGSGAIFGRLEVIENTMKQDKKGNYIYKCKCECGNYINVPSNRLRSGETASCGCLHDDIFESNKPKAKEKAFPGGTSARIKYDRQQSNNTSGVTGVSWHSRVRKWKATITYKKVVYHLGYYDNLEDAAIIRKTAEIERKKDFDKWYKNNMKNDIVLKNNKSNCWR